MGEATSEEISEKEALAWLLDDRPCVPFAGAAISLADPACAPGVSTVIDASIGTLRDGAGLNEADLLPQANGGAMPSAGAGTSFQARLLPESCYGAIASVTGNADHLRLWQAYAWHAEDNSDKAPRPNLGHHLLVWLAHHHGTPVITTNFDCFLEDAARAQDLEPVVSCPERAGPFRPLAAGNGQIPIWKLHGSADKVDSLRSQAADLVRSSYPPLASLFDQLPRVFIVGYSGRDFDIFPLIADRLQGADMLWVDTAWEDPYTGRSHRAMSLRGCRRLTAKADDVARQFWIENIANPACARAVPAVQRCMALPEGISDQIRAKFREKVSNSARTEIDAALSGDTVQARVALAATVNTVADFSLTARILTADVIEDDESGLGRMILHLALSSMDRHADALTCAKEARRDAVRQRRILGWGRAELAVTYSQMQRFGSTFYQPELRRYQPPKHRVAGVGIRMIADACILSPIFASAVLLLRLRAEGPRHYAALEFASDYIEHLIRMAAVGTAAIEKFTGQRGRLLSNLIWIPIGRLAVHVGYMRGYLNVVKYRSRRNSGEAASNDEAGRAETQAVISAAIVGDFVAEAIAYRDAAHILLKKSKNVQRPVECDQLRKESARLLTESARLGEQCGSPSLVLKSLLLAHEYGLPQLRSMESGRIPSLADFVDQLQGDANQKIKQAIIYMLTPPSPDVPGDKLNS
jgi:hypothetical protein